MSSLLAESEHRVSTVELFFDLVFVFAFTQVTTLWLEQATWGGLGRGLLVICALWWAWASYAWLTNAADVEADSILGMMLFATGGIGGAIAKALSWPIGAKVLDLVSGQMGVVVDGKRENVILPGA